MVGLVNDKVSLRNKINIPSWIPSSGWNWRAHDALLTAVLPGFKLAHKYLKLPS